MAGLSRLSFLSVREPCLDSNSSKTGGSWSRQAYPWLSHGFGAGSRALTSWLGRQRATPTLWAAPGLARTRAEGTRVRKGENKRPGRRDGRAGVTAGGKCTLL